MIAGYFGWATAVSPAMLFAATLLAGFGWAVMGGAAVNAIVSPWFIRHRSKALSFAYNGASVGGLVFSPLWVFLINRLGFPTAVVALGAVAIVSVGYFALFVFVRSPTQRGLNIDSSSAAGRSIPLRADPVLPGKALWQDLKFCTLAAGMSLGLFAQIGLLAHAFSVSVPVMGSAHAGFLLGATALMGVVGRSVIGWRCQTMSTVVSSPLRTTHCRWSVASFSSSQQVIHPHWSLPGWLIRDFAHPGGLVTSEWPRSA